MVQLGSRIRHWGFVGALLGAGFLTGTELRELVDRSGLWPGDGPSFPVVPPAVNANVEHPQSTNPRRFITAQEKTLRQPIVFSVKDHLLRATGTINEGAAARLTRMLERPGARVRIVSLNSPGGALNDAIAMGRLLREYGISTTVDDGAICASSCPLVLAGGVERTAAARAAIGLHQFYTGHNTAESPTRVMADAQSTTARISRHLVEMGVDPAMWLHALETPPRALYYLDGEQMRRYRLTTERERLARR